MCLESLNPVFDKVLIMLLSKCSKIEQIVSLLWCSHFPCEGVDNASIGDFSWKELCGFN